MEEYGSSDGSLGLELNVTGKKRKKQPSTQNVK